MVPAPDRCNMGAPRGATVRAPRIPTELAFSPALPRLGLRDDVRRNEDMKDGPAVLRLTGWTRGVGNLLAFTL